MLLVEDMFLEVLRSSFVRTTCFGLWNIYSEGMRDSSISDVTKGQVYLALRRNTNKVPGKRHRYHFGHEAQKIGRYLKYCIIIKPFSMKFTEPI